LDDVESDLKKMEVKGWKEKTRDRKKWSLVVEEAKAVAPTGRQAVHRTNICKTKYMYLS
jgi:hypothetical protein